MRVIIVGRANNQRVVRWKAIVKLTLVLAVFMGAGMSLMYWLLSGVWPLHIPLIGAFGAVALVGSGVVQGIKTPINQLDEVG